jgi:hypothetical protein
MKKQIFSKVSGDGGGGGHTHQLPGNYFSGVSSGQGNHTHSIPSHSHHNPSPTSLQRHHHANIVLYLDSATGVFVGKNRWGPNGKVSTKELINILVRILVEHVFDGRMTLFQGMMERRLKGAIKKIVKDGA